MQMARLPGVLAAEPYREVPVRITQWQRRAPHHRSVVARASRPQAHHRRRSAAGCAPGKRSGDLEHAGANLGVEVGDLVELDLLEGAADGFPAGNCAGRGLFRHPGHDGCESGPSDARGPAVTSVNVSFDQNQRDAFYAAIKAMPIVSGLASAAGLAGQLPPTDRRCSSPPWRASTPASPPSSPLGWSTTAPVSRSRNARGSWPAFASSDSRAARCCGFFSSSSRSLPCSHSRPDGRWATASPGSCKTNSPANSCGCAWSSRTPPISFASAIVSSRQYSRHWSSVSASTGSTS